MDRMVEAHQSTEEGDVIDAPILSDSKIKEQEREKINKLNVINVYIYVCMYLCVYIEQQLMQSKGKPQTSGLQTVKSQQQSATHLSVHMQGFMGLLLITASVLNKIPAHNCFMSNHCIQIICYNCQTTSSL